MLSESHPFIRRLLRFAALPYCYFLVDFTECSRSRAEVVSDLLYIFFKLKYFPDNYVHCRLDEKAREEWVYYYGSTYNAYPRARIRKEVQLYEYQIIFDDKVVSDQFFRGMSFKIPDYYGLATPDDDYRTIIENLIKGRSIDKIIIKPVLGHAGQGIDFIYKKDGVVFAKSGGTETTLDKYTLKGAAIMQEVITQHRELSAIAASSINTIRVVSLLTKSGEVLIVGTTMRFGVGGAYVDNWSAGGISIGVDHREGELMESAFGKGGVRYHTHPDSGATFKGIRIPYWDKVIGMAKEIQAACPFYRLIGIDVAIADDGPVLIEANANPDIVGMEQAIGPLLKDRRVLQEFAKYDLLINKYQKKLLDRV